MTETPDSPAAEERAFSDAMAAFAAAFRSVLDVVEAEQDPERRFAWSGQMIKQLHAWRDDELAPIRAVAVRKIKEAREMTVEGLARYLGMSVPRASQLHRTGAEHLEQQSAQAGSTTPQREEVA